MSETIGFIFIAVISAGILIGLLRLLKGPTASDRAVAMDTMTTTVVALLVLLGSVFDRYVYLDVALVYSLLAFVGLVAIARYLERGL